MERAELLEQLEKATDRAAQFAIQRGSPISVSKKRSRIGNMTVEKNSKGFYNVLNMDNKTLYTDISVFDVAVIVAQRYNNGEFSTVKKVLKLENVYFKHHTDMVHYLHCYKGAKKRKDLDKMYILEDKFQTSEQLAKSVRNSISIYKVVK